MYPAGRPREAVRGRHRHDTNLVPGDRHRICSGVSTWCAWCLPYDQGGAGGREADRSDAVAHRRRKSTRDKRCRVGGGGCNTRVLEGFTKTDISIHRAVGLGMEEAGFSES